jgi:hypothetical protein
MHDLPIIAGEPIWRDGDGRYLLMALYRARGSPSRKQPHVWMKRHSTAVLRRAIQPHVQHALVSAWHGGGAFTGLCAHRLLALAYAGWLSWVFQRLVVRSLPWCLYPSVLADIEAMIVSQRRRPMSWKITLQHTPLPGPHSLGSSLVVFGPDGTLTTEEEDVALKAMEFPAFFQVEDLSLVASARAEAHEPAHDEASPETEDEPEPEASARKRSHQRRSED